MCKSTIRAWSGVETEYQTNETIKLEQSEKSGRNIDLVDNALKIRYPGIYLLNINISAQPSSDNKPVVISVTNNGRKVNGASLVLSKANSNQDFKSISLTTVINTMTERQLPIITLINKGTKVKVDNINLTLSKLD